MSSSPFGCDFVMSLLTLFNIGYFENIKVQKGAIMSQTPFPPYKFFVGCLIITKFGVL